MYFYSLLFHYYYSIMTCFSDLIQCFLLNVFLFKIYQLLLGTQSVLSFQLIFVILKKFSLIIISSLLLNNIDTQLNSSASRAMIQFLHYDFSLYCSQSSFKISYCIFSFLSFSLISSSCFCPSVWLPARFSLYRSLLSYPLIFHLLFHGAHFFVFLLQGRAVTF